MMKTLPERELRRVRRPPRHLAQHARADQPGLRTRRPTARNADVDHLDLARVLLARPHPHADLRPVERHRRDAVHRRPVHLAGRRVHARTGCRPRSRAPSRPPSPRSPGPPARAATRSSRSRAAQSTITCALLSRPASNGIGARPGQLLQLRLRVLAHPLGRPHEHGPRPRARPGAATARRRSRPRRCCPCHRRSRSARRAHAAPPRRPAPRRRAPSAPRPRSSSR